MIDLQKEEEASRLRGSLLEFTKFFFKYITNRDFIISNPHGRESHHITVCRELTRIFRLETESQREMINLSPGFGKSIMLSHFVAWCYAHYPDCNFLYLSYASDLASKHTSFIRTIMSSPIYKYLFDVEIKQDSRAKDHFQTSAGGIIRAFGTSGSITGADAGMPGLDRFTGAVIIDDPIKPDDVHSDTIRDAVKRNYEETIRQRVRGTNVPIIFIGQRLHEDDLAAYLLNGNDILPWHGIILKALDDAGNALYPEVMPKERLVALQDKSPYVFASQYQQDPLPAGGALFKPAWFVMLEEEPEMIMTFITADTAETDKSWNDATVFSFWGVYEIENFGHKNGDLGLHWLDCLELRIQPKDLKDAFIDFYSSCTMHPVAPQFAAIEKKSTGVTLVSVLQDIRGISIRAIERTAASKSKTTRFLELQPHVAAKKISFTKNARHAGHCLTHMSKITANDTHAHDDIADTLVDAVQIVFVEKTIGAGLRVDETRRQVMSGVLDSLRKKMKAGAARNG